MKTKQIKGYPHYRITKTGRVFSLWFGRFLKPGSVTGGYPAVILCEGGKQLTRTIHRLLLETFVGPCPEGMVCRHLNGNPKDFRLKNLVWGSAEDNWKDRKQHGRTCAPKGTRNGAAKVTEGEVKQIRHCYQQGNCTLDDLAKVFNISRSQTGRIVRREGWKHI